MTATNIPPESYLRSTEIYVSLYFQENKIISESSSLCVLILDFFCCVCDLARPGYRDTLTYDIRRRDKIVTDGNGKEVENDFFFFCAQGEAPPQRQTQARNLYFYYMCI